MRSDEGRELRVIKLGQDDWGMLMIALGAASGAFTRNGDEKLARITLDLAAKIAIQQEGGRFDAKEG